MSEIRYIYSDQTGPSLNGTKLYFRTITGYDADSSGNPIPNGRTRTYVYYAGQRTDIGAKWTPGDEKGNGFNSGTYKFVGSTTDKVKTFVNPEGESLVDNPTVYTEEDKDNFKIPPGKKVGDVVLSTEAIGSLYSGSLNTAVQNSVINTAVKVKPGLAQTLVAKQTNTGQSNNRRRPGTDEAPTPTDEEIVSEDLTEGIQSLAQTGIPGLEGSSERKEYPILRYPIDRSPTQDYIQFNMLEYGTRSPLENKLGWGDRTLTEIPKGYVTLPIQPTISDQNSVDWNGLGLNAYQYGLASGAFSAMEGGDPVNSFISQIEGTLGEGGVSDALKTAIKLELAQQAVSAQGLLSRVSGAVVNPNLELLFQGPQLRPFNFTFRLSPRSEKESETVLGIIRFFKEGSAPKKGAGNLFLKAPNVFKIEYKHKGDQSHPGLNKFKTCALLACTVDYTPDGSYMTFEDGIMTSYQLNLQFSEIEPVYSSDYVDNGKPISGVGY